LRRACSAISSEERLFLELYKVDGAHTEALFKTSLTSQLIMSVYVLVHNGWWGGGAKLNNYFEN
jgi:hypothetical protein